MELKKVILETDNSIAPLASRVALALAVFPHGAQKLTGWFGGSGFEQTMEFLTSQMHLHWLTAGAVICIEFFASLLILAGFLTRLAAFAVLALFSGISSLHVQHGFFMNWTGAQHGEGIEYFVLLGGLALSLIISGGGKLSVDRRLF